MSRVVFHRGPVVPGEYHWVQLGVVWRWRLGRWWAYNGLVRFTAVGPFRVITLRRDAAVRAENREAVS